MIKKLSRSEIVEKSLSGVTQETAITLTGPGSTIRALANGFAGPAADLYQTLQDAETNSFLATASGLYLDLIGEDFGLPRRLPTPVTIYPEDRNIKVYVESGTLATQLPHPTDPGLGRVPAGTVFTATNGVVMEMTEDVDFPAATQAAFVGAVSSNTGSLVKVGIGGLTSHSLGNATVKVINLSGLQGGRELESDEDYRFRISRYVTSSAGQNEIAVRLAVLSAPGVADMIRQPYHAGAGSFRIVVIPTGNRLAVETLRQIQTSVSQIVPMGVFFQIEEPRYLPVSLSCRLVPKPGRTMNATIKAQAELAARAYLGNVRPGQVLVINRLRADILNSNPDILDVKLLSLEINRRPQVLVNYQLRSDELFIPDEEVTDPIMVI